MHQQPHQMPPLLKDLQHNNRLSELERAQIEDDIRLLIAQASQHGEVLLQHQQELQAEHLDQQQGLQRQLLATKTDLGNARVHIGRLQQELDKRAQEVELIRTQLQQLRKQNRRAPRIIYKRGKKQKGQELQLVKDMESLEAANARLQYDYEKLHQRLQDETAKLREAYLLLQEQSVDTEDRYAKLEMERRSWLQTKEHEVALWKRKLLHEQQAHLQTRQSRQELTIHALLWEKLQRCWQKLKQIYYRPASTGFWK